MNICKTCQQETNDDEDYILTDGECSECAYITEKELKEVAADNEYDRRKDEKGEEE